jgi:hypothetical protein
MHRMLTPHSSNLQLSIILAELFWLPLHPVLRLTTGMDLSSTARYIFMACCLINRVDNFTFFP